MLQKQERLARFEQVVVPHLNAAYNLAHWLLGNDQDAEDMVQEAYLRAFRFFDGYHGGDSRAWLLMIVRNTCYDWIQHSRAHPQHTSFDEELHSVGCDDLDSERLLLKDLDQQVLRQALAELPLEFREAIVLRELEGLSYKEIALITKVPLGTVMSRLSRARKLLQQKFLKGMDRE